MGKFNPLRSISGGQASRAEVYGLFVAAIVLIGGGVSGAIAFTNADAPVVVASATASAAPSGSAGVAAPLATAGAVPVVSGSSAPAVETVAGAAPVVSASPAASVSSCVYTEAQQAYYASLRAGKQGGVDQAQSRVDGARAGLASNTAHLNELLAAPYRPIEVFQWKADGTPYAWRVDSNDEIAFERQRIIDSESEIVRAEAALRAAIAERDLIPSC